MRFSKSKRGASAGKILIFCLLLSYPASIAFSNRYITSIGVKWESYAKTLWHQLPANSVLLTSKAGLLPLWYYAYALEPKPSTIILASNFALNYPWYRNFLRANYSALALPSEAALQNRQLDFFADIIIPNQHTFTFFAELHERPYHPDFVYSNRGLVAEIVPRSRSIGAQSASSTSLASAYLARGTQVSLSNRKEVIYSGIASTFVLGERIYCVLEWQRPASHSVEWRWYDPIEQLESVDVQTVSKEMSISASTITLGGNHARLLGAWHVQILVDGVVESRLDFSVQRPE